MCPLRSGAKGPTSRPTSVWSESSTCSPQGITNRNLGDGGRPDDPAAATGSPQDGQVKAPGGLLRWSHPPAADGG